MIANVHVLALLPPLEHTPDQMASRPLATLSVIAVPLVKLAEPVLPTVTLIPAGLEVIRSPLRPPAVTVRVTAAPAGFTVSVAVRVAPPKDPVIVTGAEAATVLVVTVKVALVAPAGTVTLAGTVAAVESSDSVTAAPPVGAALVSVTVPVEELPPVTLVGLAVTADTLGAAATGFTVRVAVRVAPPKAPVIVTLVDEPTDAVVTANVALVAPAATVTLEGTVATAMLLPVSDTTAPPKGAAPVNVAVPVAELPPTTVDGLSDIAESEGADVAVCGVKRRTVDHAPAVPAALMPRTRHH